MPSLALPSRGPPSKPSPGSPSPTFQTNSLSPALTLPGLDQHEGLMRFWSLAQGHTALTKENTTSNEALNRQKGSFWGLTGPQRASYSCIRQPQEARPAGRGQSNQPPDRRCSFPETTRIRSPLSSQELTSECPSLRRALPTCPAGPHHTAFACSWQWPSQHCHGYAGAPGQGGGHLRHSLGGTGLPAQAAGSTIQLPINSHRCCQPHWLSSITEWLGTGSKPQHV